MPLKEVDFCVNVIDMKKTSFTFLFLGVLLLFACSHKSETYRQLEQIDSLLLGLNMDDTAALLLKNIDLETSNDTAYFNILQAAAEYDKNRLINDTNALNFSIGYYTAHYDNQKLAYAYYYKAIYYVCHNTFNENVVFLLKKAEQNAENADNLRLFNRIYAVLTIVNASRGEFSESLKYSNKECYTAKKMHDKYCLAYAFMSRAIIYKAINCLDSSEYYVLQCKTLADKYEGADKVFLYNYLGECFIKDNPPAAKKYFLEALKYRKLSDSYANLAKIYYDENQFEIAERYCDSALINTSITVRNQIYSLMAEKSYESKNLEKYKQTTDMLIKSLKNEMAKNEKNRMLELQKKYDFEKQRTKYERKQWRLYAAIGGLIGLCLIGLILYKLRLQKIRNHDLELENANALLYSEITDLNNKIATCKSYISNLQSENQQLSAKNGFDSNVIPTNNEKINQLNIKLKDLNNRQLSYFEKGAQIFKLIEMNLPITKYNNDWADCVYYFNTKYPEQVSIFEEYTSLTISDKIFIIIDIFLQKSDENIEQILAISPVTVRSRRSKIKKKKKVSEE